MTAEQMFDELNGFINNDYELQYDFYNEIEDDLISNSLIFDLKEKIYWFDYGYGGFPDITLKLHQAITNQMEELGWI